MKPELPQARQGQLCPRVRHNLLLMDMEEYGKLASCYACAPKCREAEE